ncbi:MAG: hypothetical protein ACREJC_13390 [Tepidisphaeraceae bacterium]
MPRLALVLVWLTSNYLGRAYQTVIWPLLGFLFMPLTTLAYAYAQNSGVGSVSNFGVIVIVIAVLIDLGLLGSGEASRRKHMSRS